MAINPMSPRDKLAAAILRAIEPPKGIAPYFGAMMRGLVRREMSADQEQMMIAMGRKPTLGVTKDGVMFWSPTFVQETDVSELSGTLIHEVMHIVLKHHDRAEAMGIIPEPTPDYMNNSYVANIAMDLAINPELRNGGIKLPDGSAYPEKFELPPNLLFEEYYALLKKMQKEQQPQPGGAASGWCGSCAGHPMPGEPESGKPNEDGRSEAEIERFRKQVAEDIKSASAKERGTVPASLQRWADDYLKAPKIDWRTKLARLVRGAVAYRSGQADFTWSKVSRRQAGIGFGVGRPVVPALHSPVPNVACVIDTSGSMGEDALSAALSEIRGVLRAVGAGVTVCVCDAAVHGIKRVDNIEEAMKMLAGGGGTAMAPALEAVSALKEKVSVCIVATDGYIDSPPEPAYSVIWCVIGANTGFAPAFGDVVFVDDKDE